MPASISLTGVARRVLTALAFGLASAQIAVSLAHAGALRAAGINGKAPPNAEPIKAFVSAITDNLLWLIGTGLVLAIVVVGAAFVVGSRSAQDYLLKVGLGILVVVSAGGIAA
jgi:hypothetical protein